MRFALIDQIVEFETHKRIAARKAVSLSEEYLADHFPSFPVLPGVFMLQALVEAAGWLGRASYDFAMGSVLLIEARNVTYKHWVRPGRILSVTLEALELSKDRGRFSARGICDERECVKGRIELVFGPWSELAAENREQERLKKSSRAHFELLCSD